MNNWKKGDKAICVRDEGFKIFWLTNVPQVKKEYIVTSVEGNYLTLEGFDQKDQWHIKCFEKPKSLTRQLADDFLSNLVVREAEFERVFTLNAKF